MRNHLIVAVGILAVVALIMLVAWISMPSQIALENARAQSRHEEVLLEQARADTTLARADAYSLKASANLPYFVLAALVGAGVLVFLAMTVRRPEYPPAHRQPQSPPGMLDAGVIQLLIAAQMQQLAQRDNSEFLMLPSQDQAGATETRVLVLHD